jgi:hypothetical protein
MRGFIGIGEYKRVSSKNMVFLLERCIGRGIQQNEFGRYLSISSETTSIF